MSDTAWLGASDVETVRLTTVGIDVGSSTSHAVFARIALRRQAQALSSRFVVVERDTVGRSPVTLTPYRADGLIDAEALDAFFAAAYGAAGVAPDAVDTGAVILTGVALERPNARALTERLAGGGGRFVCASAGHHLEATLAAHGSGAVAYSRDVTGDVLHIDIGGGTSKLALIRSGAVVATAAVRVGGRLVVVDGDGVVERVEDAAAMVAEAAGVALAVGGSLPAGARVAVAERFAAVLSAVARGVPDGLADELMVTEALPDGADPVAVTLSGGVAEYVYGRATERYGDLGPELATAVAAELGRVLPLRREPVGEVIRATVIGASQFTVQLSGSTVHVSDDAALPMRNVPVVRPAGPALGADVTAADVASAIRDGLRRLDLVEGEQPVALALPRLAEPRYALLRAVADGVAAALPSSAAGSVPLVLALDGDVGLSLGRVLIDEVGVACPVVALDELELRELDFVDVGELVRPAGVVPVVVKSLVFDQPPRAARARVA